MSTKPEFEGWAIVELMGHRKLAGYVRDVTMFGSAFCRLDVPSEPPVTQYYGASAIYCVTPTTEVLAEQLAQASRPTPVHRYELPEPKSTRDAEDDLDESDLPNQHVESDDDDYHDVRY